MIIGQITYPRSYLSSSPNNFCTRFNFGVIIGPTTNIDPTDYGWVKLFWWNFHWATDLQT